MAGAPPRARRTGTTTRATTTRSTKPAADPLATSVKITSTNAKGKQKAIPTLDERRIAAMRAVNTASQTLSDSVKAGSSGGAQGKALTAAKNAVVHLRELGDLCPGDVDVERAASSVIGKLISLDMFETALTLLAEMRPRLITIYHPNPTPKLPKTDLLALISLPQPPPPSTIDPLIQTLISTYLLHALQMPSIDLSSYSAALQNTPTLLSWLPHLASVSSKHIDSVLKCAYSTLVKSSAATRTSPHPNHVFAIRTYALNCLLNTTSGIIEPNTFWDQATKFGAALVRSSRSSRLEEDAACSRILNMFSDLVQGAKRREDGKAWLSGKGFVAFCEYWMGIAKRAGDIKILDEIVEFVQAVSSPSSSMTSEPCIKTDSDAQVEKDDVVLACAKICATFAQTTTVLEQPDVASNDIPHRVNDCTNLLPRCCLLLKAPPDPKESENGNALGKLRRALERLRRACVKSLETYTESREALVVFLNEIVNALVEMNDRSSALDTLFSLARCKLDMSDPRTYNLAYDYLSKASTLATDMNEIRCVSGVFYNTAGTLYQQEKYGHLLRFLKEGCLLGVRGLEMWRGDLREAKDGGDDGKDDAWKVLDEQIFRRWELLGVCYSKIGERKNAYDAFVDAVKTFPFHKLPEGILNFGASTATKQLGSIIDRLTYLGTCELFLNPQEISLRTRLPTLSTACTGAILERQVDSLESSLWKEGVREVIKVLLAHNLEIYGQSDMSIRKARALIRCLSFMYHVGPENCSGVGWDVEQMGKEAESVLCRCKTGQESHAVLRASVHLWLGLHAHRRQDAMQMKLVSFHAEEACKVLQSLILAVSDSSPKNSKQPVVGKRANSVRRRTAVKTKADRAVDNIPVTPKPRKALETVSINTTPPRAVTDGQKVLAAPEDFDKVLSLLQMTSRLLGLLGVVLTKVHVLTVTRQLCERFLGTLNDAYISVSVELAHEYLKLGKAQGASTIFGQAFNIVKGGHISDGVSTIFFLRYAEALASADDVTESSTSYGEALALSLTLVDEDKGMSTSQRVRTRVGRLERAAMASNVFAAIQYSRKDITASLDGLLQSLRLWNRAIDNLARLNPRPPSSKPSSESDNPFEMSDMKDALPQNGPEHAQIETPIPKKVFSSRPSMDGLEWHIADGLLVTLFSLTNAYFSRGSPREALYFAEQAHDFAKSLNTPAMVSRALTKKGEILLHQNHLEQAYSNFILASELLQEIPGMDLVELHRLRGDYNQRICVNSDAQRLYASAICILEELEKSFSTLDAGSRKPAGSSIKLSNTNPVKEVLLPVLFAAILRQHIWLLRDNEEEAENMLSRLSALPPSSETKAEENSLMARLAFHKVYERLHADMFLSSLAESTITLPMGMSCDKIPTLSPATQEIIGILDKAESLFWAELNAMSNRGSVSQVRDTTVSLARIKAMQTSLGKASENGPMVAAHLLDVATAITLRRELLETIPQKFPDSQTFDDLQWPLMSSIGRVLPRAKTKSIQARAKLNFNTMIDADDDNDETSGDDQSLKQYWEVVRDIHDTYSLSGNNLSSSTPPSLPSNWTVISISVTADKSTMFVARQRASTTPFIFCVPLKERENASEDDPHLTFDDALNELREIIRLSDDGTRRAVSVRNDDPSERSRWWTERSELDRRMKELLENIEFCWLGGFKTILSQPMNVPPDMISELKTDFENVFKRCLQFQERRPKYHISFDDTLVECFSTLSPTCQNEEIEDLVYFILDLYQFHGVPVEISDVPLDLVIVQLRMVLEQFAVKMKQHSVTVEEDSHMFLVLDRNVQGIPWESIPILRGKSVSRIPSMDFLLDRLKLASWTKGSSDGVVDRFKVNPKEAYYVLNPSGDLKGTEARLKDWLKDMHGVGWEGVTGRPPSEQQFLDALSRKDLVIYFGHGGGEQYARSHKIRHLPRCAATMLWGCSSGALREMGDFDRVGTPYNYMLAGCPTLVANLWDVTDRDIDKFAMSVFGKIRLTVEEVDCCRTTSNSTSVVTAVAQSRESCKLKYLTGAAPVIYGIPFYL